MTARKAPARKPAEPVFDCDHDGETVWNNGVTYCLQCGAPLE